MSLISLHGLATAQSPHAGAALLPKPMRSLGDIHRLPPEQAAKQLPVEVSGVITAFSGYKDSFFLEDATGATSVNREEHAALHMGDRVRAVGSTRAGSFAPVLVTSRTEVLGRGTLPGAHRFNFQDLQGGVQDSHWIEVHGIVRSARLETVWDRSTLILRVDIGGGSIAIHILDFKPEDGPKLVDAVITVRGVCGTVFNEKRQFTGARLFVQDLRQVTVDEPAPADPFATTSRSIDNVLQFQPGRRPGHRVKIAGVVTFQNPGHSLFIQDGQAGIEVLTEDTTFVPVGSRIEAVGFPELGVFSPILQAAIFRTLGAGPPPRPAFVGKDGLIRYDSVISFVPLEDQLVHLEGIVVESKTEADFVTTVRVGRTTVLAMLQRNAQSPDPPLLEPGTDVSITGVLTVELDHNLHPAYFHVLMRSSSDLVVLKRPPWWTASHLLATLAMAVAVILGVLLWGILLRHRVRQQTAQLRESEERFRCQAQTDALTGLASRSFFHERLREAIREADLTRSGIALLMIDLDFFKQVNDTLGHHAGDQLLCIVADRLRSAVRKEDIVARLGGDEFIVLLQPLDRTASLESLGSIVVRSVCTQAVIGGNPMQVSASVGICAYPAHAHDFASLLQNVDAAMYRAKAAGRNSFAVFEPATRLNRRNTNGSRAASGTSRAQATEPRSAFSTKTEDSSARSL